MKKQLLVTEEEEEEEKEEEKEELKNDTSLSELLENLKTLTNDNNELMNKLEVMYTCTTCVVLSLSLFLYMYNVLLSLIPPVH